MYVTDMVANFSYNFLDQGAKSGKPFFLTIAPIAPHGEVTVLGSDPETGAAQTRFSEPVPALRHMGLFMNKQVPRTPDFNPNEVGILARRYLNTKERYTE